MKKGYNPEFVAKIERSKKENWKWWIPFVLKKRRFKALLGL
jgi:hypothetical protein